MENPHVHGSLADLDCHNNGLLRGIPIFKARHFTFACTLRPRTPIVAHSLVGPKTLEWMEDEHIGLYLEFGPQTDCTTFQSSLALMTAPPWYLVYCEVIDLQTDSGIFCTSSHGTLARSSSAVHERAIYTFGDLQNFGYL